MGLYIGFQIAIYNSGYADLVGGFANGLAIEREVRGRLYIYWQLRDLAGRLRQIYLGPAAEPTARELRDALAAYKHRRAPIVADLERLTATYVASGGPRHLGTGGHLAPGPKNNGNVSNWRCLVRRFVRRAPEGTLQGRTR